ncbi:MAG: D-glycerate dehydrogenase [Alicyclobacillaceae bacterium]|nr:D-glycerate dehydrogenase [Alicyclobacillaceae bacterium]
MTKPTVFVPHTIPDKALHRLHATCEVIYRDLRSEPTQTELADGLRSAKGMVCYGKISVRESLLEAAPQLEVVSNIAVGFDNFDLAAMQAHWVSGTNTPGVLTETTADLAFALLMAAARRIPEADAYVKSGQWQKWVPDLMVGSDVYGKTIGIVGMGRIGEAVARRALGFGMTIVYHNRRRQPNAELALGAVYRASLEELLGESDFVVLLTPLTKHTFHLIGEDELCRMKRNAWIINVARGAVLDESALMKALDGGWIAGAGLDVYEEEPLPANHPLLSRPNVVTLPHIGSATVATRENMALTAVDNIIAYFSGRRPPNLVNPDVWERRFGQSAERMKE